MTNPIRELWNDYSTAPPESKRRIQRYLTVDWLIILAELAVWFTATSKTSYGISPVP